MELVGSTTWHCDSKLPFTAKKVIEALLSSWPVATNKTAHKLKHLPTETTAKPICTPSQAHLKNKKQNNTKWDNKIEKQYDHETDKMCHQDL